MELTNLEISYDSTSSKPEAQNKLCLEAIGCDVLRTSAANDSQGQVEAQIEQESDTDISPSVEDYYDYQRESVDPRQSNPERMRSVERNSELVKRIFPGDSELADDLTDRAYRYLMHNECVDDYSSSMDEDMRVLEQARPGILRELDDIIAKRFEEEGPAPGSMCAALTS